MNVDLNTRKKILDFFDNTSKKDYKLKELNPELYNKMLTITSVYGDQRYFRKIQVIRDKHKYILFRLSQANKIKWFSKYCYIHRIPMSTKLLQYYNMNINIKEFYVLIHGSYPKCSTCKNDLKSLKVQLYSTPEENEGRFCSKECQKHSRYKEASLKCEDNNSELVEYSSSESIIKCNRCDNEFKRNTSNIFNKDMYTCNNCLNQYSNGQKEIYDFLKEYVPDLELEVRDVIKGISLDIYSGKHKIAIEYDGLMYHSYGKSKHSIFNNPVTDKNKHLERKQKLAEQQIKLFRVQDIEWLYKKEIWKSILLSAFGLTEQIPASECDIIELELKEAKGFMSRNHLQGYQEASKCVGLQYNRELVFVMTVSKYNEIRFCSKLNTTIINGVSELVRYIEDNTPKDLVSYVNLRWCDEEIYEEAGFILDDVSPPNSFYFLNNYDRTGIIYNSTDFTKSKLEKYFKNNTYNITIYDKNKSELQNMFDNGYRVILDCGDKKYVKKGNNAYN